MKPKSPSYPFWLLPIRCMALWALLLLIAGVSACGPDKPTQAPVTPSVTPTQATPTPSPTATFTPPPPRALLVVLPGSDPVMAGSLQTLLTGLATQAGLKFQLLPALSAADLTPEVRAVAVLGPDPGLAALAAAAPQVKFLAVGNPGLQAGTNLGVVNTSGGRPDQAGFAAGYLAAALAPDWRAGVISIADTPDGKAARNGFLNGVVFYCGLCRPVSPPFFAYPLYSEVNSGAAQADLTAAADYLIQHGVNTVYVAPGITDLALFEYLAQNKVNLIGSIQPPEAVVQAQWIATLHSDPLAAVAAAWPKLLDGQEAQALDVPLVLSSVNEALFSPGRQRLVEATLADLQAGFIDTGVDLASGENR